MNVQHLFGRLFAPLESFDGDGDRWFAVDSVDGATHGSELATAERVVEIQLSSSDVELDVSVHQVASRSHVQGFAVVSKVKVAVCSRTA